MFFMKINRMHLVLPFFAAVLLAASNSAAAEDLGVNYGWQHNSAEKQLPFAEAGDPLARFLMFTFYATGGGGVQKDGGKAAAWLKKSAAQNYPPAMLEYAKLLYEGSLTYSGNAEITAKKDEHAAVKILRGLADAGAANAAAKDAAGHAAFLLGYIYEEDGAEIKADGEKSVQWYRRAAELNNDGAAYRLGAVYAHGLLGAAKNPQKAAEWWKKAAGRGHAAAQYALGRLYSEGYGVEKDEKQAALWWRLAAAQGNEDAVNALKEKGLK